MIIQNKKNGQRRSLTQSEWEKLQKVGFAKYWHVVSRQDVKPKKMIPKEIIDFSKIEKKHGRKST